MNDAAYERAIETVDAELLSLAPFTWEEHADLARLVVDALVAHPDVLRALCSGTHLVPVNEDDDTWEADRG